MVRKEEIIEIAGRVGLTPQVVEKDYALGWLLAGIHQHPALQTWIFKGGTCLKKCYFETYRFSEDLDFTVTNPAATYEAKQLKSTFEEVAAWVEENSGLEIPKDLIDFEVFTNPRNTISIQGKVAYRGPVRPDVRQSHLPKIKIDVTIDEPVVLTPIIRQVDHAYSDIQKERMQSRCYAYEEIYAEKTRALVQRLRPRDLYDVIHLFRRRDLHPDQRLVRSTLESKCNVKGIAFPTIDTVRTHENRQFVESEWETMLSHQVSTLPPFEQFLDELPQVFSWIEGAVMEIPKALEIEEEETVKIEPITPFISIGASNMQKIRFSAANRLVLRLHYQGTYRNIEPYSLARSSDGNLLLRAIKADTGEPRSYRLDRFQGVDVTKTPFKPRYDVEITSSGSLPIHQLTRNERPKTGNQRGASGGMTYIFKCSRCGKQFKRKSYDASSKEHKGRDGRTCYGYLSYLRTEY